MMLGGWRAQEVKSECRERRQEQEGYAVPAQHFCDCSLCWMNGTVLSLLSNDAKKYSESNVICWWLVE